MRYTLAAIAASAALVLAGCGDEDSTPESNPSPEQAGGSNELSAKDVAAYLDRELEFDSPITASAEQASTAFRDTDVLVRVFDSESELDEAQEKVTAALGNLAPSFTNCGVIEVSVVADETPRRAEIEAEYVRRFDEALQREYEC